MKKRINNTVWLAAIIVFTGVTGCSKKETYVKLTKHWLNEPDLEELMVE